MNEEIPRRRGRDREDEDLEELLDVREPESKIHKGAGDDNDDDDEMVPRKRDWERTRKDETFDPMQMSLDSMKINKDNRLEYGRDEPSHQKRYNKRRERGRRFGYDRRPELRGGPVYDNEYQFDRNNGHGGEGRYRDDRNNGRRGRYERPPPNYGGGRYRPKPRYQKRTVYSSNFDRLRQQNKKVLGVGYAPKFGTHESWIQNSLNREARAKTHPYPNDHHIHQNKNPEKITDYTEEMRLLKDDAPQRTYYSRKSRGEMITVNHWGQRKLLLSEIEFLTNYSDKDEELTIVYAGAAPGIHIPFLSSLFPSLKFVLVDPSSFSVTPVEGRIEVKQQHMTVELAKQYFLDPNVLLISDIRTAGPAMDRYKHEETIKSDNQLQFEWHQAMRPRHSMFKFRCPYFERTLHIDDDSLEYTYLNGKLFLPVWGPQSTTETRLVVKQDATLKKYNIKKYEDQMFYFNTKTRVDYYEHNVTGVEGLDHCYDCRSELFILENFIRKFRPEWLELNEEEIKELFNENKKKLMEEQDMRRASASMMMDDDDEEEETVEKKDEPKEPNPFKTINVEEEKAKKEAEEAKKEASKLAAAEEEKKESEEEKEKRLFNLILSQFVNRLTEECSSSGKRTLKFIQPTRKNWHSGASEKNYLKTLHQNAPKPKLEGVTDLSLSKE